jgi:hypothetical protein
MEILGSKKNNWKGKEKESWKGWIPRWLKFTEEVETIPSDWVGGSLTRSSWSAISEFPKIRSRERKRISPKLSYWG